MLGLAQAAQLEGNPDRLGGGAGRRLNGKCRYGECLLEVGMTRGLCLASILAAMMLAGTALSQPSSQSPIDDLENRVTRIESTIDDLASMGVVLFFFGAFCALWAQNSGRNAWLWFFLGAFFSILTVLVLLSKNSADRNDSRTSARPS